MQNKSRKWFSILGLLFLTAGLIAGAMYIKYPQFFRGKAASSGPTLTIAPSTKTSTVDEVYSLSVILNTDTDTVSAVELHLTYDSAALEIQSFTPGTDLPVVLSPTVIGGGSLAVTLGVSPTAPFKGSTTLGTLSVKALTSATSSISFAGSTLVASIGKPANSLASATGAQINPPAATVAPTPTATSTPGSSLPASTTVYKLTNNTTKIVFLTANEAEKNNFVAGGWTLGASPFRVWTTQAGSSIVPAYRLHSTAGVFIYTFQSAEKDSLVKGGWVYDGIAFYVSYSNIAGTVPVYRLSKTQYIFTASTQERDSLIAGGYHLDGVAFYAVAP